MIEALTNLDKSSWEKHRFDEIAMMVSERVDPNNTDLEIYVGLEHLDSESLHIRSHGTAEDVNGTKLRFYKGDVIFGRRRAYQRKAAIAKYDGFCSAHALVLRAKPEVIDPALFPFFLHSDQFMHRAVDISVGSLSPTINWKSLRKQQFLLPPKREQARLAELLWAGDGVLEGLERVLRSGKEFFDAKMTAYFNYTAWLKDKERILPDGYKRYIQKQVARFINGRAYKKDEWETSGVPVIRLQNLTGSGDKFYYSNLDLPEDKYCYKGDLLFMWSATFGAHFWSGPKAIYHYHIWKIECDDNIVIDRYMYYSLEEVTRRMQSELSGSTMLHMTKSGIEKLKIILPSKSIQMEIIKDLDRVNDEISGINDHFAHSKSLQKSLINQIF